MINNTGPIDQLQNVQLEEVNEAAGAASVTPTYLATEVGRVDEASAVSSDSTAVSSASSSGASIGSSETHASWLPRGMSNHWDDMSNYILNLTPQSLELIYQNRVADSFTFGGNVLRELLPEDVSVYESFEAMNLREWLSERAPELFGNAAPAGTADNSVEDIDTYVDPFDPSVANLLQTLKDDGVITDDMTADEIAAAVYNYLIENFDYMSDGSTDIWATVSQTISRGGGDCEDLSFLLGSLLMAALIDCGMTYNEAQDRVQGAGVNLDNGQGHIYVAYTADDGSVRVLDPTMDSAISNINSADVANLSSKNVLFTFDDSSVAVVGDPDDIMAFAPSYNYSINFYPGTYLGAPYNDPYAQLTTQLVNLMVMGGILNDSMSEDEIAAAIFNYIMDNFVSKFNGRSFYGIGSTSYGAYSGIFSIFVVNSGGWFGWNSASIDFSGLHTFLEQMIESTLVRLCGMSPQEADARVSLMTAPDGHLYVSYTDSSGVSRVLDFKTMDHIDSINEAYCSNPADYIDPYDPQIQQLLNRLKQEGIITAGMSKDDIALAVLNYIAENPDAIPDSGFGGSATGAASLLMAALMDAGMSYERAASRVYCVVAELPNGDVKVFLAYRNVEDNVTRLFDTDNLSTMSSLQGYRADHQELKLLYIFNDNSVTPYNLQNNGVRTYPWMRNQGANAVDTIVIYSNGQIRVYTGDFRTDHINCPAEYLSYINRMFNSMPEDTDLYGMAAAIDAEFDFILEAWDENDFWNWAQYGFKQIMEARQNALILKMQKLTNLYNVLQMIHKLRMNLRGVVQEEMEGIKGFQGMDTAKLIGKSCQSALNIVLKLHQQLMEKIMKFNEARLEELKEEAEEANDSKWEQFVDKITFGENTRKVIEEQMKAIEAYMDVTKANLKALESMNVIGTSGHDPDADADPTNLDDPFAQLNKEIDERLEELLGRLGEAIRKGDNDYLWVDNDFIMKLRDEIVGLMNGMRSFIMIETSKRDIRSIVHEEMTGVSGYKSEKQAILQAFENKFAYILMHFDRMAMAANLYVNLHNQYVYLQAQYDKYGGGFWDAVDEFWSDLTSGNWGDLVEDISDMFHHFPGFLRGLADFYATLLGWVPVIGGWYNLIDAAAVDLVNNYYDDEMNVPPSQYNPEDTRTSTGDIAFDLINQLEFYSGQTLSQVGSNLFLTADDGLYQIDYVGAAMLLETLNGYQNAMRIVGSLNKHSQMNRRLVHMEMTGVDSREPSQAAMAAMEADFNNQMMQFNTMMMNLIARKVAHNLEQQQENQIDLMWQQAVNGLWRIIPGFGDMFAHFANLDTAMNNPAYGMDLDASPSLQHYQNEAADATGISPEARIEDLIDDLYNQLLSGGLVYAGGISSGIDPALESRIKQEFKGLANVMYILSELANVKLKGRDIVHKEMTGVSTGEVGELSNQVLDANFQTMMRILDFMLKWFEEVLEVEDRADQAEMVVDRLNSMTPIAMISSIVTIICIILTIMGFYPAVVALIAIANALFTHIYTLGNEADLLDDIKSGGYGDLSAQPQIDFSESGNAILDILSDAEESIFTGINSDLISELDGGGSYVHGGHQANADYQIGRLYNVRRMLAKLYKMLQEIRNEIHLYMTGVSGNAFDSATGAFNRGEQVAKSILEGLFRRLDRMAARDNMIHQAEITYQSNIIQSWISCIISIVASLVKLKVEMMSKELQTRQNMIDNRNQTIEKLRQQLGDATDQEQIAKINDDINHLMGEINEIENGTYGAFSYQGMTMDQMRNTIRNWTNAGKLISMVGKMIPALIEYLKEYQKMQIENAKKNLPFQVKGSDKSSKEAEGGKEAGNHSGWVSQMDSMEADIVNYQVKAATHQMNVAEIESRMRAWNKFLEQMMELLPQAAATITTAALDRYIDKNTEGMREKFERCKADGTLEEFRRQFPAAYEYFSASNPREASAARMRFFASGEHVDNSHSGQIEEGAAPGEGRSKLGMAMGAYNVISWITDPVGRVRANHPNISLEALVDRFMASSGSGQREVTDPAVTPERASEERPLVRNIQTFVQEQLIEIKDLLQRIGTSLGIREVDELAEAREEAVERGDNETASVLANQMQEILKPIISGLNIARENFEVASNILSRVLDFYENLIGQGRQTEVAAAPQQTAQAGTAQQTNNTTPMNTLLSALGVSSWSELAPQKMMDMYFLMTDLVDLAAQTANPNRSPQERENLRQTYLARLNADYPQFGELIGKLIGSQQAIASLSLQTFQNMRNELSNAIRNLPPADYAAIKNEFERRLAQLDSRRESFTRAPSPDYMATVTSAVSSLFGFFGPGRREEERQVVAQAKPQPEGGEGEGDAGSDLALSMLDSGEVT